MLEFLCDGKVVKSVTVEVPLNNEENISVTTDNSCLATILDSDVPLSTVKKPASVTEVRDVAYTVCVDKQGSLSINRCILGNISDI